MKDIKDIILERRIRKLEVDGKEVPRKYLVVFNDYIEEIANHLSDYTKQMRKEVVGDLKEELKKNGKCSIRVNGTMDFFIELDKLNEILNQIQD